MLKRVLFLCHALIVYVSACCLGRLEFLSFLRKPGYSADSCRTILYTNLSARASMISSCAP